MTCYRRSMLQQKCERARFFLPIMSVDVFANWGQWTRTEAGCRATDRRESVCGQSIDRRRCEGQCERFFLLRFGRRLCSVDVFARAGV